MKKVDKIWMDGKLVNWDDAKVHVLTHTLHYGLGVFEGIRCYQCHDGASAVFRLTEHIDRLFYSAIIGMMDIPFSLEELCKAVVETLRANKMKDGYIRPIAFIGDREMVEVIMTPRNAPSKSYPHRLDRMGPVKEGGYGAVVTIDPRVQYVVAVAVRRPDNPEISTVTFDTVSGK